jgi:hypothetical protein
MRTSILFAAALLAFTPAWAINKCTDLNGKVSYQDDKCPPGKSEEVKITNNSSQGESGLYGGYGGYGGSTYGGGSYGGSGVGSHGSGVVHTGPRGGRYTIGPSGNKNYISRK